MRPTVERIEGGGVPILAWTEGVPVEEQAKNQLRDISKLEFVGPHIAVMPDVHLGIGATVGSVIPTRAAIIPAAVGVDIGCGMVAMRVTGPRIPDGRGEYWEPSLVEQVMDHAPAVRSAIEAAVPHGRTNGGRKGDRGAWGDTPRDVLDLWHPNNESAYQAILKDGVGGAGDPASQLGTLGSGNHFIEVCTDEAGDLWLMLHSGSRGVGNRIGTTYIERAREWCLKNDAHLPNRDLAWFPDGSEEFAAYWRALNWAQHYAALNRRVMLGRVSDAVSDTLNLTLNWGTLSGGTFIESVHNYVVREEHFDEVLYVTRKGAVSALKGELGIIPGSMGAASYLVRGKGNPDSFNSCSHGAGRRMSRSEAKRTFTVEDHAAGTVGVECRKDEGVLDETPGAYKDIDAVMAAQDDLVEVVHTLKQIICIKG